MTADKCYALIRQAIDRAGEVCPPAQLPRLVRLLEVGGDVARLLPPRPVLTEVDYCPLAEPTASHSTL